MYVRVSVERTSAPMTNEAAQTVVQTAPALVITGDPTTSTSLNSGKPFAEQQPLLLYATPAISLVVGLLVNTCLQKVLCFCNATQAHAL